MRFLRQRGLTIALLHFYFESSCENMLEKSAKQLYDLLNVSRSVSHAKL